MFFPMSTSEQEISKWFYQTVQRLGGFQHLQEHDINILVRFLDSRSWYDHFMWEERQILHRCLQDDDLSYDFYSVFVSLCRESFWHPHDSLELKKHPIKISLSLRSSLFEITYLRSQKREYGISYVWKIAMVGRGDQWKRVFGSHQELVQHIFFMLWRKSMEGVLYQMKLIPFFLQKSLSCGLSIEEWMELTA